jgi:hypothetical protein
VKFIEVLLPKKYNRGLMGLLLGVSTTLDHGSLPGLNPTPLLERSSLLYLKGDVVGFNLSYGYREFVRHIWRRVR